MILSQYDDPNYAIALLSEGAEGYAYLLKDRVAEGDQLAQAIREVAAGGSKLDPKIVDALIAPVTTDADSLSGEEEELLRLVAEGRPIKRIAAAFKTTPADASASIERLFLKLAQGASTGAGGALQRLKMLHQAIVDLDERGESMSRLLPGGVAEKLRREGRKVGETEKLTVTVLMSDIRGYSTIAEETDPSLLAGQLNIHRIEMNKAVSAGGGNVWQFVGDAVMAVFGAPLPQDDHTDRSLATAVAMHAGPAGDQPPLAGGGPGAVRDGHRPQHRRGGGRPVGVGGAPGVLVGRRYREHGPASPAVGGPGPDGAVGGYIQRFGAARNGGGPGARDRQGPQRPGSGIQTFGEEPGGLSALNKQRLKADSGQWEW